MADSHHSETSIKLPNVVLDGWALDNHYQHGWMALSVTDDHPSSTDGLLWDGTIGMVGSQLVNSPDQILNL
jgi:hypothetical protein